MTGIDELVLLHLPNSDRTLFISLQMLSRILELRLVKANECTAFVALLLVWANTLGNNNADAL